jgi:hypothetical protein
MTQPLSGRQNSDWRANIMVRQVTVVVCTATATFAGHTYHLKQQRLSDVLNKGFSVDLSRIGGDFLPLNEVEIFFPDGSKRSMTSVYIRKTTILFVAEVRQLTMAALKDKPKIYPVKATKPIRIEVFMPGYTLVGKIHGETWHQLSDAINRDVIFLPLTNVEISPGLAIGESRFDFVAINKDRIVFVGESLEKPKAID